MGIKYLSALNMNQNPIYGLVLQSLSSAPSNPVEGQIYFDTVDNQPYCYIDYEGEGSWVSMTTADNRDFVNELNDRVGTLESLLTGTDDDSADTTINRLSEVLTFLNGVADDKTLLSSFLPATKDSTASSYTISNALSFDNNLEGYASSDDYNASWSISKDGSANFKSLTVSDAAGISSYPVLTNNNFETIVKLEGSFLSTIGDYEISFNVNQQSSDRSINIPTWDSLANAVNTSSFTLNLDTYITNIATANTKLTPFLVSSGFISAVKSYVDNAIDGISGEGVVKKSEFMLTGDGVTKAFQFEFICDGAAVTAVYDYDSEEQVFVSTTIVGDLVQINFAEAPAQGKQYRLVCVG